ncbi:MAG: DUF4143 domain-containing protein [Candidatus Methanoplasma sp.]|jgi:hypothetical protein|nr:DUF4143 domain-containing protein [Candidatus Methanoplasma sp.]
MFGHVRKGARARDLEDSLQWLIDAGLAHKVPLVERPGAPLSMFADRGFFKIYMSDVGLFRCMAGAPPEFALGGSEKSAPCVGGLAPARL